MRLFEKLGIAGPAAIDWELTPVDTFGTFESWGGRERVRNNDERFYYFYVDNWEQPARLCLMERGVKHARVVARIEAPQELIDRCVAGQGKALLDQSYAIDDQIKEWLVHHVLEADDALVVPVEPPVAAGPRETGLPGPETPLPAGMEACALRSAPTVLLEAEIPGLIARHNFFDRQYHPEGRFANFLVDNQDGLTVTDRVTGLMWQRGGCDITAIRQVHSYVAGNNRSRLAGFDGWRLPTMEEALSLLEPVRNDQGLYLHPAFSAEQPFIFLADERRPGGYWFIDFKQGTVFWASGTIPGGFGRLVRSL